MSTPEAIGYLKGVSRKFFLLKMTEVKLQALGIALLVFALSRLLIADSRVALAAGAVFFFVVLVLRVNRTGALSWNALRVALFLNRHFPELKDSADLLVSEKPVSTLEELQRAKVARELELIKSRVRVPHRIGQGLILLATGLLAVVLLHATVPRGGAPFGPISADTTERSHIAPRLHSVVVVVSPPAYTGVKRYTTEGGNFKVPVNSRITWEVSFTGKPVAPLIMITGKDSLMLRNSSGGSDSVYQAAGRAGQAYFYQVLWRDTEGKRYSSDYFQADIREDAAPVVKITGREQFQVVRPGEPLQFTISAQVSDDYVVRDAHLVATVSKGSGESVKFREVTLPFDNPRFPSRQASLTRSVDLGVLGLEPGDELYFYAEALDNRMPVPNLSRTETFFIALQDTAEAVAVADAGLGVDLMPDYFRSQRQIIIDTEKLLADRRRIKKQEFNARSNELGFDQKALRLKYGQFLGMEDEAGIGVVAAPTEVEHDEEEDEEDPSKKFGHQHDKENEHNLVAEKKNDKEAGHDHGDEEDTEDPLKAFIHQHDGEEEATFFIQSVKTKLKAALTLMWDSELHLRMYEPAKSLPYQYRILNLLKEIAQDNRAYVHRTGFDAPPIKEERRLTGDLDEASGSVERVQMVRKPSFPAIRLALPQIEEWLQRSAPLPAQDTRSLLEAAGGEVADEALKKPGNYLKTLSALRRLADGTVPADQWNRTLRAVRSDLWKILPEEAYGPSRARRTLHPLDRAVLDKMAKGHD